jgi:biotin carboxyl carrier protein
VRFDVDANGRRHAVEARRAHSGWLVTINGRPVAADVTRVGERWSVLIGAVENGPAARGPAKAGHYADNYADNATDDATAVVSGFSRTLGRPFRSYDVAIENLGRGERMVHVDGREIAVSFANGRDRSRAHTAAGLGPVRIASPMAGRVVKVLVAGGDAVAARQGLVIVEAMKMENELRAPRAGTVREVQAREGGSVEAGAVLVVIE